MLLGPHKLLCAWKRATWTRHTRWPMQLCSRMHTPAHVRAQLRHRHMRRSTYTHMRESQAQAPAPAQTHTHPQAHSPALFTHARPSYYTRYKPACLCEAVVPELLNAHVRHYYNKKAPHSPFFLPTHQAQKRTKQLPSSFSQRKRKKGRARDYTLV
jgi:hypothetical protein